MFTCDKKVLRWNSAVVKQSWPQSGEQTRRDQTENMSLELCRGPLKCHMIIFFMTFSCSCGVKTGWNSSCGIFLKFGSARGGSEADTAAHMSLSGHHDFIRVQLKIITAPYPGFILKGSAVFSPSTSGMLLQPRGCVESHKKTDWWWRPMIETSSSKVSCWWTVSCIGLLNHELSFLLFSPCVLKHKPHTSVWFKVPSQAEKAWSNLMEQSV